MEINREEIIKVLGDMGVELPADTKLPLDALQQRLTRAIDLAQAPLKIKEVNPDKLKKWSEVSKAPLFNAMGTMSLKEAAEFKMATTTTPIVSHLGQETPTSFGNAFMFLRSAVRMIGGNWDTGSKLAVVEDEGRTYGFTMRVRSKLLALFFFANLIDF